MKLNRNKNLYKNKKRPVEKPRQRWMDRVKDDLKRLRNGASIGDAENREGWGELW